MSTDLIFHVLSKRKWQERNRGGLYSTGEEFIECVDAPGLTDYLNNKHGKRKNLLLLVIDRSRVSGSISKSDENENLMSIKESINLDAILDKIRIDANTDGKFDILIEDQ